MAITYRTDKNLGCTIAVWDGDLTSEDMQSQLITLASDTDWPPGPRHLIDGTTLGTVIVPDPELVDLLYEGTNLVGKTRIAILVSADFFDAPRPIYEVASDEFDAATFTDLDSACEYLGLSAKAVQPTIAELRKELERC